MAVPEAGYFRLAVETGEKESGHAFVIHNVIPWISSPALRLSLCSFLLTLLGGGLDRSKVTEFGLLLLLVFCFFFAQMPPSPPVKPCNTFRRRVMNLCIVVAPARPRCVRRRSDRCFHNNEENAQKKD